MYKNILLILMSIALAIGGQILLKTGVNKLGAVSALQIVNPLKLLSVLFTPHIFFGLCLYAASAVAWIVVLSRTELSYAYPFLGLTYVAMLPVSKYVFAEDIAAGRWVGSVLIFMGVVLSARA